MSTSMGLLCEYVCVWGGGGDDMGTTGFALIESFQMSTSMKGLLCEGLMIWIPLDLTTSMKGLLCEG